MTNLNNDISEVIDRLLQIPVECRNFNIDESKACSEYRFTPDILDFLKNKGISHRLEDGAYAFCHLDLITMGYYMRIPTRLNLVFRTWGGSLKKYKHHKSIDASFDIIPIDGSIDDDQTYEFEILTPQINRLKVTGQNNQALMHFDIQRNNTRVEFSSELRDVIDKVLQFDFFMLPEDVRWDLDFILKTKMADCGGSSKYCHALLKEKGFEARHCFGIVLAEPFGSGRYFTEVRLNDRWVAIDPHLIKLLRGLSSLKNDDWSCNRSPGEVMLPLGEVIGYRSNNGTPILRHFDSEPYILNPICTMGAEEILVSMPIKMRGNENG
jgi:hypothetical protein